MMSCVRWNINGQFCRINTERWCWFTGWVLQFWVVQIFQEWFGLRCTILVLKPFWTLSHLYVLFPFPLVLREMVSQLWICSENQVYEDFAGACLWCVPCACVPVTRALLIKLHLTLCKVAVVINSKTIPFHQISRCVWLPAQLSQCFNPRNSLI